MTRLRAAYLWVRRRAASEEGSAAVEFVYLAVLLMIPLIYLILMLGRLQAGSYAVSAAVRESGRAFVTAPDDSAAYARAHAASNVALANLGFTEGTALYVACEASPCLTPGAAVVSEAEVRVPLPLVPTFARGVIPLEVPLRAQGVSRVDRFRSAP